MRARLSLWSGSAGARAEPVSSCLPLSRLTPTGDGLAHSIDIQEHSTKAAEFFSAKQEAATAEANKSQTEFLATAAAEEGATETGTGLVYKETLAGNCSQPVSQPASSLQT